MNTSTKHTLQFILSWIMVAIGCILVFAAFFVPPQGEIHGSVIAVFGEMLTFSGAIIGIDYSYKKKFVNNDKDNKENK